MIVTGDVEAGLDPQPTLQTQLGLLVLVACCNGSATLIRKSIYHADVSNKL